MLFKRNKSIFFKKTQLLNFKKRNSPKKSIFWETNRTRKLDSFPWKTFGKKPEKKNIIKKWLLIVAFMIFFFCFIKSMPFFKALPNRFQWCFWIEFLCVQCIITVGGKKEVLLMKKDYIEFHCILLFPSCWTWVDIHLDINGVNPEREKRGKRIFFSVAAAKWFKLNVNVSYSLMAVCC